MTVGTDEKPIHKINLLKSRRKVPLSNDSKKNGADPNFIFS